MPRRSWPILLLLIAFAPVLRAQSTNASLSGHITDPVRAVVVKANVAAINLGTNVRYETTTNAEGEYYLSNLPPGLYCIDVEKPGFKKLIKSGVSLHVDDATEVDLELALGLMSNEPEPSTASAENAPPTPPSARKPKSHDIANDPTSRLFQLMLPSAHLLGDWDGLRSKLEEKGITPRLILVTDLAGNSRGGRSQGATAPSSFELSLSFDLEKIVGLKGGSILASFSERWGHQLSAKHIGNTFSTQQIFGFQTWRVLDVSYQQKLFDDRVELRVGRFAAMDDFLVSPYNFGFMQNAFCGNPFGIILSAPGMSAYYGTWAALGKVKPTKRSYVMTGFYNGDPKVRENKYHGVNLSLKGPLFAISEAGYQINGLPGDSQRLGNYKLGAWYDRSKLTDFNSGASKHGSWGYYGLFDQVLVPFGAPGSNRGFGVFGSATVAPNPRFQQLPLFVTAGVSARGLFDARPRDVLSLGVASGYFSEDLRRAQRKGQLLGPDGGVPDRETVTELTYRFDLRNGAYFIQPDLQYITRPGGTGQFKSALVVGAQFGINF
jgi:porin